MRRLCHRLEDPQRLVPVKLSIILMALAGCCLESEVFVPDSGVVQIQDSGPVDAGCIQEYDQHLSCTTDAQCCQGTCNSTDQRCECQTPGGHCRTSADCCFSRACEPGASTCL